ncbi:MAG: GTPase Era [Candidatus Limimorpha sp.]|nr:GTPase Era [Bacteroidales bacterium]MDD5978890.1 GTPase Era [Bacteroidales bacterium]MDD7276759.1 GTPase Era [Bacteroidales bacterium]MDY6075488.1 GTPase Era [Bacteroidales bacterium]
MDHKAGYVNIIGKPNVGKSTLMNALVGEKISIITSKAQTTRHRILGIVNGEDFQIVFSDTPGIIKKPAYKMHEIMNQYIKVAFIDADLILYVVDITDKKIDEETTERIKAMDVPVFVLLNKIDLSNQEEVEKAVAYWSEAIPQATVFPISAKHEANIQYVLENIIQKLPECPPYFPKDELTDRSMRFFITEIIREKILLNYQQEIPYSVEVVVDAYEESQNLINIKATIFASRESQKAILIGKGGSAIKKTGIMARADIEEFTGKKIFLDLRVKVDKDWRDNEEELRHFGYEA